MKRMSVFVIAGLALGAFGQVDPARVVATVNGEAIKGSEYYRRMEFLPNVGKMIGGSFATAPPGFLTLDQLINEKLLLQLARDKGVMPSDAEVSAQIKLMMDANPKAAEQLALNGMTQADLEYQVRLDLAQFKLQTRGITVTDQEVEQQVRDHDDDGRDRRPLRQHDPRPGPDERRV
mgnify:CR=1 FL=1